MYKVSFNLLKKCFDKIVSYPVGYEFTIEYRKGTLEQQRALMSVIKACEEHGLIECVSYGLSFEDARGESGTIFHYGEATYKRI